MKNRLLFFLVPFMALVMTSCVLYNGQGKPGTKTSSQQSSEPSDSGESSSSGEQSSGQTSDSTPAPSSGDSSLNPSSLSSAPAGEDVPVGTQVKVYLVFGEYGKYKGNFVNTGIDSLYLEHAMEYIAKVGDDLPGKADVTSSVKGSEFVAWTAYNNDGKMTEYTKVPATFDKILYASFSGGSGQGGGSSSSSPSSSGSSSSSSDLPQDILTINFSVTIDTGMDVGVYLVGDFCEWTPANNLAIKFEWSEGNVWTASRQITQGTIYHCKLVTAPYNTPSQVYSWEKEGEGNERVITFTSSTTMNFEWGNY